MPKDKELLQILEKQGKITANQIDEIVQTAASTKAEVADILVEKKIVTREELTQILAQIYNLEYANLTEKELAEEVLHIIPLDVANNYKIVCFDRVKRTICVGLTDPNNYKAIEAVEFLAKRQSLKVKYFLISLASFHHAIGQYKNLSKEISSALETRAQKTEEEEARRKEKEGEAPSEVVKSAPVAKIVSVIMRHAVEGRASDIHIEPLFRETRVRYRIDGILHTSLTLPRSIHNAIVARIKVLANLKLDETRVPQDGRIREIINGKEIDFRVSILPLLDSEKVVMRIFDLSRGAPKLEELGFMGVNLEAILENIKKPFGLILVTGPTGSGKSTTLFSMVNMINKEGINISTIEDPIEYHIPGANQSQVRPEVGYTFASGLRSLLRQDPDVIMVGEIRDQETAELAIHAGLTGHFVLSTLHTNDAIGAIPRLLDMGVEAFLLGSTLNAVIAQRLARKICENCKEKVELPAEVKEEAKKALANTPRDYIKKFVKDFDENNLQFYRGKGCPRCGSTGYSGRIAVAEVLDINDKLREMIIKHGKSITEREVRQTQTFISMYEDGLIKALMGLTSLEEVMRVVRD